MLNVIKTAIITIIISFISGLLLDYYKSLAPKILCEVQNGVSVHLNKRKYRVYIINVSNPSKKTIHNLTVNIHSLQGNFMSTDAKITKGLKFDSSIKDNLVDFSIPFLSEGDNFSVTVYVENQYEMNKPVITIRSPEKFKQLNSLELTGIKSLFFKLHKNMNQTIFKIMNKVEAIVPNGKYMFIIISVISIILAGVLTKTYLRSIFTNSPSSSLNSTIPEQINNSAKITEDPKGKTSTENSSVKASSKNIFNNSNATKSSGNTIDNADTSSVGTTDNRDKKASSITTKNSTTNSSSDSSSENPETNSFSENTAKNSVINSSSDGTSGNSVKNSTSENTSRNSVTNSSSQNVPENSTSKPLSNITTSNTN